MMFEQGMQARVLKDLYVDQLTGGKRLSPSAAQNPAVLREIASHHVDLDRGVEGFINDGSPKSYLHKGGNVIDGSFDKYKNPLPGKPAGAKELRQLDSRDAEKYDAIFESELMRRKGTGNMASNGIGSIVPFT